MADDFTSIDSFQSNSFFNKGFITDSRFEVIFHSFPTGLGLPTDITKESLSWNIKSVDLPSTAIGDTNNRIHQTISSRAYGDLTITFFESIDQDIKNLFYTWIENTIPWNEDNESFGQVQKYINDFSTKIEVQNLNGNGDGKKKDIFHNAFPKSVEGRKYNIESDSEIGTIAVTFGYKVHTFN